MPNSKQHRDLWHERGKAAEARRFCKVQRSLKDTKWCSLSSNGKCEFPKSHLSKQRDINISKPINFLEKMGQSAEFQRIQNEPSFLTSSLKTFPVSVLLVIVNPLVNKKTEVSIGKKTYYPLLLIIIIRTIDPFIFLFIYLRLNVQNLICLFLRCSMTFLFLKSFWSIFL